MGAAMAMMAAREGKVEVTVGAVGWPLPRSSLQYLIAPWRCAGRWVAATCREEEEDAKKKIGCQESSKHSGER